MFYSVFICLKLKLNNNYIFVNILLFCIIYSMFIFYFKLNYFNKKKNFKQFFLRNTYLTPD